MTSKVQAKPIPTFANEEEERRFWEEHDPSEYFTEPADLIVQQKRTSAAGGRRPE